MQKNQACYQPKHIVHSAAQKGLAQVVVYAPWEDRKNIKIKVRPLTACLQITPTGWNSVLPRKQFLRLSRSAIVNFRHLSTLKRASSRTTAALDNGQQIPVTRSSREVGERLRRLPG
ncbi:hypothetical protein OPIT5_27475 [Opitutaceae bacterium TAV5]|nr:hypothetical protein OPIT5_27475 [Opitutaceae bacterium TAV5]